MTSMTSQYRRFSNSHIEDYKTGYCSLISIIYLSYKLTDDFDKEVTYDDNADDNFDKEGLYDNNAENNFDKRIHMMKIN